MQTLKLRLASLAVLACLLFATPARAQDALSLQSLRVELWPEFDKPAVLVILSGTLDPAVSLPAEIVLRLPAASGGPHAVAARDDNDNLVNTPYTTSNVGGEIAVTVTAAYPNFHLEYYDATLATSGDARNYVFRWTAGMPAASVDVRVQQPVGASNVASSLTLSPAGAGEFGLNYYTASLGPLAADQSITFVLQYDKSDPTLSSDAVGASQPITPDLPEPVQAETVSPWVVGGIAAFGLLLAGGGVFWLVRSNRAAEDTPRPRTKRGRGRRQTAAPRGGQPTAISGRPSAIGHQPSAISNLQSSRFCHECGQPLVEGDKFCRSCGTPVRETTA